MSVEVFKKQTLKIILKKCRYMCGETVNEYNTKFAYYSDYLSPSIYIQSSVWKISVFPPLNLKRQSFI